MPAAPGDVVIVSLNENPMTGYRWHVTDTVGNVVNVEGADFEPDLSGALGAGGQRVFAFRVEGPGRGQIRMVLRREWEPPTAADDEWQVAVVAVAP